MTLKSLKLRLQNNYIQLYINHACWHKWSLRVGGNWCYDIKVIYV